MTIHLDNGTTVETTGNTISITNGDRGFSYDVASNEMYMGNTMVNPGDSSVANLLETMDKLTLAMSQAFMNLDSESIFMGSLAEGDLSVI